jgi:hypothetical protein
LENNTAPIAAHAAAAIDGTTASLRDGLTPLLFIKAGGAEETACGTPAIGLEAAAMPFVRTGLYPENLVK